MQDVLERRFGSRQRIRRLRCSRCAYSSSCTIKNLQIELGSGRSLSLVLKDLSPASQLAEAKAVRPRFLYHPLREIEIYRRILGPRTFGTAVFFGSYHCQPLERYWLFLERVNGALLWQVGEMESWRSAARWLADFHSEFHGVQGGTPVEFGILHDSQPKLRNTKFGKRRSGRLVAGFFCVRAKGPKDEHSLHH